jgi:hypothetical protein
VRKGRDEARASARLEHVVKVRRIAGKRPYEVAHPEVCRPWRSSSIRSRVETPGRRCAGLQEHARVVCVAVRAARHPAQHKTVSKLRVSPSSEYAFAKVPPHLEGPCAMDRVVHRCCVARCALLREPSSLISLRKRSLRFCWVQRCCIKRGHVDEEEPLAGVPGAILWFKHADDGACEEIFGVGVGSGMPRRDRVQPLANVALPQLGAHELGGGCIVLDHDGERPSHPGDRDRIVAILRLGARQAGGHPAVAALAGS